jgi:putative FmdB family regulatory protein
MPLYEYRCKACGHRFEKIQSFSAPDEKECPVCKGEVERLISAPAVQFKGSGFYSTDYGAKSAPSKSSSDSSKDTSSPSSESKPATTESSTKSDAASAPAKSSTPSTTS